MRLEFFISWRYLVNKKKEKFITLISIISLLGIAIGVMALIVVISVMSGFDEELRNKIVGNFSHITVSGYMQALDYALVAERLSGIKEIRAFSPQVEGQVFLVEAGRFFALGLKGVDPLKEKETTKIRDYLIKGNLKDLSAGTIFLGKELAGMLGLGLADKLKIFSPLGKAYELKVAGIFYSGMYDYDSNLVFVDLKTSQEIFALGDRVTSVAVKLNNLYLAEKLKKQIEIKLGFDYNVRTWGEVNKNFFSALKLEKLAMFIILTLIVLVAAFNIISTLIVIVVQKTKDIGILKAVGLNQNDISRIFIYQGLIIGTAGVILGGLGGWFICLLLKRYQFIRLPQDIYYIERLPVALQWWPDIILIILAALAITLISTIYPSRRAGRLKPAEALRYE